MELVSCILPASLRGKGAIFALLLGSVPNVSSSLVAILVVRTLSPIRGNRRFATPELTKLHLGSLMMSSKHRGTERSFQRISPRELAGTARRAICCRKNGSHLGNLGPFWDQASRMLGEATNRREGKSLCRSYPFWRGELQLVSKDCLSRRCYSVEIIHMLSKRILSSLADISPFSLQRLVHLAINQLTARLRAETNDAHSNLPTLLVPGAVQRTRLHQMVNRCNHVCCHIRFKSSRCCIPIQIQDHDTSPFRNCRLNGLCTVH